MLHLSSYVLQLMLCLPCNTMLNLPSYMLQQCYVCLVMCYNYNCLPSYVLVTTMLHLPSNTTMLFCSVTFAYLLP